MPPTPIHAVTFDFWRTLFYASANMQERRDARAHVLVELLGVHPSVAKDALKHQEQQFLQTHIHEQRTLVPEDAVNILTAKLGLDLDPTMEFVVADGLENATLEYPPSPIEGAVDAVLATAEHVPVGIISDTGMATGRTLRRVLDHFGFTQLSAYTFSDETQVSKPQAKMYYDASTQMQVPVESLLHIGDLEPTDIAGAISVGAHAALFAGDNDRFLGNTKAGHTFTHWDEYRAKLPELLKQ